MELTNLERDRIAAVDRSGLLGERSMPALDVVARTAATSMRTSMGFVTLIGAEHQHAIGSHGIDLAPMQRQTAICNHTICTFEPFVVPDTRRDPRFADNPLVTGEPFLRAYAGVALVDTDGHALGALCVAERYARSFEAGELLPLLRLSDIAVRLIEIEARQTHYRLDS